MNMELWRFWFFLSTKETLNEREREYLETLNWMIKKEAVN
jgi:hypothetical protein